MRIAGAIDLHVHAGPDVRPRKTTAAALAAAAAGAGMGGFVLKRHHTATVAEAAALQAAFPALTIAGGVALNSSVGGVNPAAVEVALAMGARIVWLPTCDAAHERAARGAPGTGIRVCGDDGRVLADAAEVVKLVAERGATLGLGHVSPDEMFAMVRFGRRVGVRQFLVNHPEIKFLDLPVAWQREMAGPDLLFERCYVRAISALDWDGFATRIREVGVDGTALATDLGQADNAHPVDGFAELLDELAARGFSDDELTIMARRNPRRVVGP